MRILYIEAVYMISIGVKPILVTELCIGMLPRRRREPCCRIIEKRRKERQAREKTVKNKNNEVVINSPQEKYYKEWDNLELLSESLACELIEETVDVLDLWMDNLIFSLVENSESEFDYWQKKSQEIREKAESEQSKKDWCIYFYSLMQEAEAREKAGMEHETVMIYEGMAKEAVRLFEEQQWEGWCLCGIFGLVKIAFSPLSDADARTTQLQKALDFIAHMPLEEGNTAYARLVELTKLAYQEVK